MKKIEELSVGMYEMDVPGAKYATSPCATCICKSDSCYCDPGTDANTQNSVGSECNVTSINHPVQ